MNPDPANDASEQQKNKLRGDALMRLHRHKEAIQYYVKALGQSPQMDAVVHADIALCWNARRQYGRAERSAKEALSSFPEFAWAWYVLAIVQKNQGNHRKAVESNNVALRLNPADTNAIAFRIHRLCDKSNFKMAETEFKRALASFPENQDILHAAVRNCISSNQLKRAKQFLDTSMRINPESSDAQYYMGCYWSSMKEYKAAEDCYREALRLDPTSDNVQERLRKLQPIRMRPVGTHEAALMFISTMIYALFYFLGYFPFSLLSDHDRAALLLLIPFVPVVIYAIYDHLEEKKKRTDTNAQYSDSE